MTARTIIVALFMSGVFGVVSCSKSERSSRRAVGTAGTAGSSTDVAPALDAGGPAGTLRGSGYRFAAGYPTADGAKSAIADTDFSRAVQAYHFWYPTVSAEGIFQGVREIGLLDNVKGSIGVAGPRHFGLTLNSDTPFASAALDVSEGPMVIDLPAGPYIGLVNDHNQTWILDMGLPGPNAGKGGKHLVLPPGYKGNPPAGYQVGRSETNKILVAVRAVPAGGDQKAALSSLRAIKIYPLNARGRLLGWEDTSGKKMDSSSLRWEDNFQFWQVLKKVIDEEPVPSKSAAMYGLLASLGIEKGKAFNPDGHMKGILERAARAGRDQMLVSVFASTRSDRIVWSDRRWEWAGLVPDNGTFAIPMGLDMEARDRWFAQAIVTSPAMFRRTAAAGSLYWLGARDNTGAFLDGSRTYRLTVPQPVPFRLFWSVTVYDAATRSEVQTDQDRAALRSLFELKNVPTTRTTELYFGPAAPSGRADQWIKTIPGRGWFVYFRVYGPEKAAFDGSWKPGDFEEMK
jgi:hypothetical protein